MASLRTLVFAPKNAEKRTSKLDDVVNRPYDQIPFKQMPWLKSKGERAPDLAEFFQTFS